MTAAECRYYDAEYAAYLASLRAQIEAAAVDGEIQEEELAYLLRCGEGEIPVVEVLGYTPLIVDGFARLEAL